MRGDGKREGLSDRANIHALQRPFEAQVIGNVLRFIHHRVSLLNLTKLGQSKLTVSAEPDSHSCRMSDFRTGPQRIPGRHSSSRGCIGRGHSESRQCSPVGPDSNQMRRPSLRCTCAKKCRCACSVLRNKIKIGVSSRTLTPEASTATSKLDFMFCQADPSSISP